MASKFNADEILEMAERIESRGAKFYRKAAKLHVGARELLTQIAEQEDQHFKTFEEMRRALSPAEKDASVWDPSGESEMYLQALVDQQAFEINKDPADAITGKELLADIFKMAIEMEKDSIVFYLGLKQVVPPSMGKDRLDAIVKEEMTHITWLNGKRAEIKA
jgi:rubrerythrin